VPEESTSSPSPNDDAIRRLERRLEALEYVAQTENRWWRGGLIAALVLVALSILILAHHRHHPPPPFVMGRMGPGMMGGEGMMPYGPPPPYWGPGPQSGYGYGPPPWGWHHHHHDNDDDGPGAQPEMQPPGPQK